MDQYIKNVNSDLVVDIRRVLGSWGEYNIGLSRCNSTTNSSDKEQQSIFGDELDLTLNYHGLKILEASFVVDEPSQSIEGGCRFFMSSNELVALLGGGRLHLEIDISEDKDD